MIMIVIIIMPYTIDPSTLCLSTFVPRQKTVGRKLFLLLLMKKEEGLGMTVFTAVLPSINIEAGSIDASSKYGHTNKILCCSALLTQEKTENQFKNDSLNKAHP